MEIVLEIVNEPLLSSDVKADSALKELSKFAYEKLVQENPNHLLVQLLGRIDLESLAKKCNGYRAYQVGKRGVAPQYTMSQLCGCLLLRHLYGWSYQMIAEKLATDMMLRYAAGFTLFESTPSVSTIRLFEEWLKEHKRRLFFDELLRLIDDEFPEERKKTQYGDTFAMYSRAAKQSRNAMMRGAAHNLLDTLSKSHPEQMELVCTSEQRIAILGADDAPKEEHLKTEKRKKLELCTAEASFLLLKRLGLVALSLSALGKPLSQKVEKWQSVLTKILNDAFLFTTHQAENVTAQLREKAVKGAYRLGSVIDLEATFRDHGKRADLAYNINIATTDIFVREIAAVTGAVPDAKGIPALLTEQLVHHDLLPPKFVYDSAAGYPAYFAQVHQATNGRTQLVARLIDNTKNSDRFGPLDFTLGDEGELTCPGGVTSTKAYLSGRASGYNFRFAWPDCDGCAFIEKCRGDKVKVGAPRTVFISLHRKLHREALAYTETDAFKEEYKQRSHVERIIAGNTRYNGSRRARAYGIKSADFQAKMGAMAYNAKRFVALLLEKERAQKRNRGSPHEP